MPQTPPVDAYQVEAGPDHGAQSPVQPATVLEAVAPKTGACGIGGQLTSACIEVCDWGEGGGKQFLISIRCQHGTQLQECLYMRWPPCFADEGCEDMAGGWPDVHTDRDPCYQHWVCTSNINVLARDCSGGATSVLELCAP